MENKSEGAAVIAIAIGLLLVLLAAGGGGLYYLVQRQHMALMMQAEQALVAEAEARQMAELTRARADAMAAAAAQMALNQQKPSADTDDSIRIAITAILNTQAEAWNRGDLDAFMEHYWKSDELTFSSGGKTTRGWSETLKRYRERYPTPEKMGRLKFDALEVTPLGESAVLVLGQWQVERDSEPLSGNFSLVVRKFDDRWQIVHDHTSRKMD